MPAFRITANEAQPGSAPIRVRIALSPEDPASHNIWPALPFGWSMIVEDGAHADADTLDAVCTGGDNPPSLLLAAEEDGVVFQVSPAPPSGPALFGPLNVADDPVTVPSGTDPGTYTVTAMTYAKAQSLGLVP